MNVMSCIDTRVRNIIKLLRASHHIISAIVGKIINVYQLIRWWCVYNAITFSHIQKEIRGILVIPESILLTIPLIHVNCDNT